MHASPIHASATRRREREHRSDGATDKIHLIPSARPITGTNFHVSTQLGVGFRRQLLNVLLFNLYHLPQPSAELAAPFLIMSLARSIVSPAVRRAQLARRAIAPASASAGFSSSSSSLASSSASSSKPKAAKRRGCSSVHATTEALELTRLRSY
jgi:hypothetical protein